MSKYTWILLSAASLGLVASGRISNYTQSFWHPVLVGVCVLIIIFAVSALGDDSRAQAEQIRHAHAEHAGHHDHEDFAPLGGHEHRESRITALLWIPLILIVISAPSSLGSAMLDTTTSGQQSQRKAASQDANSIRFAPLSNGVNEMDLEELDDRYSFSSVDDLAGHDITFVGFVSPSEPGALQSNRFKIYCCAADAISYGARVITDEQFPVDSWVEVTGTVDLEQSADELTFIPSSITKIDAPKAPYL